MDKPLAIDLCCGLHGWAEGLVAEGYRVIGFDLENMCAQFGQPRPEHVQLVIQDILTLHGSQFKSTALIVASPPCQAYSYRAMPWKKATALPPPDNSLFEACFRIQREACEAAGRHIPMVVENVRGAQKWVGRARWNFGSFYFWGDVPALMPPTTTRRMKSKISCAPRRFADRIASTPEEDHALHYRMTDEGVKCGGDWFNSSQPSISRLTSSKSPARKMASAMIAKIPLPLSRHIAAAWKP